MESRSAPATASAAASVQPPAKTEGTGARDAPRRSRRSYDQAIVASSVRWRSSTSRSREARSSSLCGQPLVDRCRGERAHAGGRELDREWELIDGVADRVHVLVRLKAGAHRRGALDEEHVAVAGRHRRNLVDALGPKTQALTAGRDHDHVGAAGHELADELGNPCDEVLAVVDHDQRPPRVERGDDRRSDLEARPVANFQGLSERRANRGLVSQRRKGDPVHAIGESIRRLGGGLKRESSLSRAPGSGERDESRVLAVEKLYDLP